MKHTFNTFFVHNIQSYTNKKFAKEDAHINKHNKYKQIIKMTKIQNCSMGTLFKYILNRDTISKHAFKLHEQSVCLQTFLFTFMCFIRLFRLCQIFQMHFLFKYICVPLLILFLSDFFLLTHIFYKLFMLHVIFDIQLLSTCKV